MVDLLDWNAGLTAGELAVATGTLALAGFTWKLARLTADLDDRNAARERKRREREVRGVARLVDGELGIIEASLVSALGENAWHTFLVTPHGAWDRDGALIAESVPQDEAQAMIDFMAHLTAWEQAVAIPSGETHFGFVQFNGAQREVVEDLITRIREARGYLQRLAYPDARDLEPDPDSLLAFLRKRRKERRQAFVSVLKRPLRWFGLSG
jgi:hypothetical protein